MPRHRHADAYAAVVLAGGYVEAGDHGRVRVQPGHVVIHCAHEAHQDHFSKSGAAVLNIPLSPASMRALDALTGHVPDPDAIARLSECDIGDAAALLQETFQPRDVRLADWPDQLAAALASNLEFSIEQWAAGVNLAPPSISRGFRQAYGVTPKRYRFEQRALRAIRGLRDWTGSLAELAAESGFADQAHLSRAVVALTGLTPQRLRIDSARIDSTRIDSTRIAFAGVDAVEVKSVQEEIPACC